jgi:hypothetical protein
MEPIRAVGGAIMDMGAEASLSSLGQAAGSATGPFSTALVPTLGAVGGATGNALGQVRRMMTGNQDKFSLGQITSAAATGAIPGASLAKATAKQLMARSILNASANVAAATAQQEIDDFKKTSAVDSAGNPRSPIERAIEAAPTTKQLAIAAGAGVIGTGFQKYLDMGSNQYAREFAKNKSLGVPDLKAWQAAREAGYMFPATILDKQANGIRGRLANMVESVAGKSRSAQEFQDINSKITDELAGKALGLPGDMSVTTASLNGLRKEAKVPYDIVAEMSSQAQKDLDALKKPVFLINDPHEQAIKLSSKEYVEKASELATKAGANLDAWKEARVKLNGLQFAQAKTGKVLYEDIAAAKAAVERTHNNLVDGVKAIGGDKLAKDLERSKVLYAKIAEVERALESEGHVSAAKLSASDADITGELSTIAETQRKFSKYLIDRSKIATPAGGKLSAMAVGSGLGSAAGMLLGGAPGAGAGASVGALAGVALPSMLNRTAVNVQKTNAYQNFMTRPFYGQNPTDFSANLAKYLSMGAGRQMQPEQDPAPAQSQ